MSNVQEMNSMFYQAEEFDDDVSKWDVSRVEDMNSMFYQVYYE